ncbi:DUF2341 domain-containing protein [Durusdinium trenchii]|uniref:DUF2341 domain-containing protein n=1 Tax=Durusdinium trenchii TaxID=1381693 RepID=A0ABP0KVS9_9DINO
MRADKFVRDPAPECRTNPTDNPSGCGKACVFCMQAADGDACPAKSKHNDISKGIGKYYDKAVRTQRGNQRRAREKQTLLVAAAVFLRSTETVVHYVGNRRSFAVADAHMLGRLESMALLSERDWHRDVTPFAAPIQKDRRDNTAPPSPYKIYEMDDGGDVFVKESDGESWALVMKLSKQLAGQKYAEPSTCTYACYLFAAEYDAKSKMFHTLKTTAIKLQTDKRTPETLITTNQIKIKAKGGFNTKKYWKWKWEAQYGNSRQLAPAFMRADKFVLDPACVFCFQAADGNGCPAHVKHNDISVGIGLSQNFCGGGNKNFG